MSTFADLIDAVTLDLTGYSMRVETQATLVAPLAAGGLKASLDSVGSFGRGVVEIDGELLYVSAVDTANNVLTLAPWGRGYRNTEALNHKAGASVTMSPAFPRATVARAINQAIAALYPTVYAIGTASIDSDTQQFSYPLPAVAERVVDVRWRQQGPTRNWERVAEYDVLHGQDTTDYPGGVALELYDAIPSNAAVQVVYACPPRQLTDASSDFSTTGLLSAFEEVVTLGATYRMLPALDAGRLPRDAASAVETDAANQVGAAGTLAKTLFSLYSQRLNEAKTVLDNRYPARYRRLR